MLQRIVVDLANIQPPDVFLSSKQQHYLSRVLRLGVGDRLLVMDGQGHTWLAWLKSSMTEPPQLTAHILEPVNSQTELLIAVTLVIALPKGNGFDEIVRQATELGVSTIAPVISDRTLLHPSAHKLERWQRIAQEAAEQSERQFVPAFFGPISWSEHLQTLSGQLSSVQSYLCVTRQQAPHLFNCLLKPHGLLKPTYSQSIDSQSPPLLQPTSLPPAFNIAIGPEGGWTDNEISQAIVAGYQPVSLGDRILRTVTAPLMALSLIAAICESRYGEKDL